MFLPLSRQLEHFLKACPAQGHALFRVGEAVRTAGWSRDSSLVPA